MKLRLKETLPEPLPSANDGGHRPGYDGRYSRAGMEEEHVCSCPVCHREIEPDEDGKIEGDEIEILPSVLSGLLGLPKHSKIIVIEKRKDRN